MGNSNGKPIVLNDAVNLNHFRLLRVVGKGAFGKVRIVERKVTGVTFALKYIRKDEVVRSESVRNIIRERRMLEHLNHPFLCNLRYSFQDMEYLYIVVDLMNGGDLRFHISRKTFTEAAVRFWVAELGCALRYIHQQGIVHRDVKPDNVLLDSDGHVHLADFNVASDYTPNKPLTSKSGTLAYLAPEVYLGRGYQTEVDWWSLGVTFYECIYNKRPFEANNHEGLAQAIIKASPPFPVTSPAVSMPCNHAISSLLEKDKTLRIGASSFESFTDNPFFRAFDFDALERKEVEPVFLPPSEKTNFDATYDLEELLLEEAPLEARARKQKPRAELRDDATAQEIRADELHRMIETLFEPFNYTLLPERRDVAPAMKDDPNSPASATASSPKRYAVSERAGNSPVEPPQRRSEKSRSTPASRSQTPGGTSRARSSTHSADGSPPIPPAQLATAAAAGQSTISPGTDAVYVASPVSDAPSSALREPPREATGAAPQQQQAPKTRTIRYTEDTALPQMPTGPGPTSNPSGAAAAASSPKAQHPHRLRGSTRSTSVGGGVQVVLNEQGSWSDMANQSHGMVHGHGHTSGSGDEGISGSGGSGSAGGGGGGGSGGGKAGMLGFLSRKKGRGSSPKASKSRERGVLGKEGARVVVGS